jgi:hypothetical protein
MSSDGGGLQPRQTRRCSRGASPGGSRGGSRGDSSGASRGDVNADTDGGDMAGRGDVANDDAEETGGLSNVDESADESSSREFVTVEGLENLHAN